MTDLEMTKLCAEAMGLCINDAGVVLIGNSFHAIYAPLTDDSQAMALVKKFRLRIYYSVEDDGWYANDRYNVFLNDAIVECVATSSPSSP